MVTFTYDVKGSIGVQHYRQDASNYFPLDAYRSRPMRRREAKTLGSGLDSGAQLSGAE